MTKRRAKDDLNSLNWDRDDRHEIEAEEQTAIGSEFKKASDDILSRRVIRKAKRTLPERDDNREEPKLSLFSSFQGFKKPDVSLTATTTTATSSSSSSGIPSFSFLEKFNGEPGAKRVKSDERVEAVAAAATKPDKSVRLAKIKGLNESVSRWITDHVQTNPLCDLTPIFDDYRKYWTAIEAGENVTKVSETVAKPLFTFPTTAPATTPAPFSFNLTSATTTTTATTGASPFVFKPQTNGDAVNNENDDEDNQPPPIEDNFDDIKEDGSIFSIKCKVFFMENGTFADKGICYAFVKPIDTKLQLIARLNNKLGTIVVNTLVTKPMTATIQKRNEKNVLITCVPNATQAQNPLPVLFKVKSGMDADRFIQTLNDNLH